MKRVIVVAALCAAACQSSGDTGAADPVIAAAQGPAVQELCFTGDVGDWSQLKRDTVLLERDVQEWFQVDVAGTCDAEWVAENIARRARVDGASCIAPGERIETFTLQYPVICTVRAIHEWDRRAAGDAGG